MSWEASRSMSQCWPVYLARSLMHDYNPMCRPTEITEKVGGSSIAKWSFWGPSRVAELSLGNGLICTHLNNVRSRSSVQAGESSPGSGDRSSGPAGLRRGRGDDH